MTMQLDEISNESAIPTGNTIPERLFSGRSPEPFALQIGRDAVCEQQINEWSAVLAAASGGLPFHEPEYVQREMEAREPGRKAPALMVVPGDSHLPCGAVLLPRMLRRPAFAAPWRKTMHAYYLAGGQFFGSAHSTDLPKLVETLIWPLQQGLADLVYVEDLETDSPLWSQLMRVDPSRGLWFLPANIQPRLKIRMPQKGADYWNLFSTKTRSNFRRRQKKAAASTVVCVTRPDQVDEFVRLAHQVSLQSWQTRRLGLRIENNESQAELFRILARRGALRSYLLMHEGEPVAFLIGNQSNGVFRYEEVGYDPRVANWSPGTLLLLHTLDDLFAKDTPEWFDFGAGDADYKRLFANTMSHSGTVWLLRPGLETRLLTSTMAASHYLGQFARSAIKQLGIHDTLRRLRRFGLRSPATEDTGTA